MKAHTNLDTHKGGMIKTTFQSNENFGLSITKMNPGWKNYMNLHSRQYDRSDQDFFTGYSGGKFNF